MTAASVQPLPKPTPQRVARALRAAALGLLAALWLAPAAQAAPVLFAPFSGSGNAVVFDTTTGEGGWVGSVLQDPDPAVADPLDLVSVVLFRFDPLTQALSGTFEFTRSADLGSALSGLVTGSTSDGNVFATGGQLALDYTITGGSGDFAGYSGFGLSFLQIDPAGLPDNYSEAGLLVLSVPEPGTLPLLAGALGLLVMLRRWPRCQAPQG